MKRVFTTTLRLNLEDGDDRRAFEHLQRIDKRQHRSYSKAVVAAVNGYFERMEQTQADPLSGDEGKRGRFPPAGDGNHRGQPTESRRLRHDSCTERAVPYGFSAGWGRYVGGIRLRRQLLIPVLPLFGITLIPNGAFLLP